MNANAPSRRRALLALLIGAAALLLASATGCAPATTPTGAPLPEAQAFAYVPQGIGARRTLYRVRTPLGWVVTTPHDGGTCYVPDAEGAWQ